MWTVWTMIAMLGAVPPTTSPACRSVYQRYRKILREAVRERDYDLTVKKFKYLHALERNAAPCFAIGEGLRWVQLRKMAEERPITFSPKVIGEKPSPPYLDRGKKGLTRIHSSPHPDLSSGQGDYDSPKVHYRYGRDRGGARLAGNILVASSSGVALLSGLVIMLANPGGGSDEQQRCAAGAWLWMPLIGPFIAIPFVIKEPLMLGFVLVLGLTEAAGFITLLAGLTGKKRRLPLSAQMGRSALLPAVGTSSR